MFLQSEVILIAILCATEYNIAQNRSQTPPFAIKVGVFGIAMKVKRFFSVFVLEIYARHGSAVGVDMFCKQEEEGSFEPQVRNKKKIAL